MATDLFGNPITDAEAQANPSVRRVNTPAWKGGYAAAPGSGPAGETCRSCVNYGHGGSGARSWPKCELLRHAWTSGPGTDIKAKAPACRHWQPNLKSAVEL